MCKNKMYNKYTIIPTCNNIAYNLAEFQYFHILGNNYIYNITEYIKIIVISLYIHNNNNARITYVSLRVIKFINP